MESWDSRLRKDYDDLQALLTEIKTEMEKIEPKCDTTRVKKNVDKCQKLWTKIDDVLGSYNII